jgi:hypothetical protein
MAKDNFMDSYNDVASRLIEFRNIYPEGSLQQQDLQFVNIGGKDFVIYTAAAYRTPDDQRPGVGTAWEPIPGKTSFTRDSEVMVAETSAWGRAMVAALAVDTKKGIASANEVANRQTPTRDFLAEASSLKSLDALRDLWAEARKAGATQETLDAIIGFSNGLSK